MIKFTGDAESLSPKQKEVYTSIRNAYMDRTGAVALLGGNETGTSTEGFFLENMPKMSMFGGDMSIYSVQEGNSTSTNSAQSTISNSVSNTTSKNAPRSNIQTEPVNMTGRGLESYFLGEEDSKFLTYSAPYVAGTSLENPGVADPNSTTMSDKDRESFRTKGILKEGIGEYTLEDIESYSKPQDLYLEVLEFRTEADKKKYIKEELEDCSYFTNGRILAYIQPDAQNMDASEYSRAQKVICLNAMKKYSRRTGLDMVLSGDEATNKRLLDNMDKFIEEYYLEKGIIQE
jgi:hypothetical protein